MAGLGISVGHTGGNMLGEALIAAKSLGGFKKGGMGGGAVSGKTGSIPNLTGTAAGAFSGGLAGMVSRKAAAGAAFLLTSKKAAPAAAEEADAASRMQPTTVTPGASIPSSPDTAAETETDTAPPPADNLQTGENRIAMSEEDAAEAPDPMKAETEGDIPMSLDALPDIPSGSEGPAPGSESFSEIPPEPSAAGQGAGIPAGMEQGGNHTVEHDNEDEFISEVFYILFNRKTSAQVSLGERVAEVLGRYIMSDEPTKLEEVDVNELAAPPSIDFTHSRYILMDGLNHSYLVIPADAYKVQVVAGWLSLIVNAGEGIDVDLSNAIQSGYFPKRGIANNEDFYYLSIIITITADSVKNLDWRVKEMRKLLISQDMDARVCGFLQEDALLSVLPIAGIGKKLYRKTKRNILTTGAASCYPFTSFEMSDDNGILMGVNKYNNSLVVVDIFNSRLYKNANMAILGTSGAGKTFTMQLMALRLRQHGIQVFILAPPQGPRVPPGLPEHRRGVHPDLPRLQKLHQHHGDPQGGHLRQ